MAIKTISPTNIPHQHFGETTIHRLIRAMFEHDLLLDLKRLNPGCKFGIELQNPGG